MELKDSILKHLKFIYADADILAVNEIIVKKITAVKSSLTLSSNSWSEKDVILITYGDSIHGGTEMPLYTLDWFIRTYLKGLFSIVHILPFFPYSSDDGFSVIDYRKVNSRLGDWHDIQRLTAHSRIMADLVINHTSKQSEWFQNFLKGRKPGKDFFIEADPGGDLSAVVRPRSLPLLTCYETVQGPKYVWTTFSEDQIDLNFRNPAVLIEMVDIFLEYILRGISVIRLDAIAFLWKKPGTNCLHLPETHEIVKLLRTIVDFLDPSIILITETNVPNKENLSYFGKRDEAHMVYNFSLPPLILYTLFSGDSSFLTQWASTLPDLSPDCTFLNFTASHDGIGVRPLEGLLPIDKFDLLIESIKKSGGLISFRKTDNGKDVPYELNISYLDSLKQTIEGPDELQTKRFLCSQTIMLSMKGIPAIYINSIFGAPNYYEGVRLTGINRTINRQKWDYTVLNDLFNIGNESSGIFNFLKRLIQVRKNIPEFHPNADQQIVNLGNSLFIIYRCNKRLVSISNITKYPREINIHEMIEGRNDLIDLISGDKIIDGFILKPYQSVWVKRF